MSKPVLEIKDFNVDFWVDGVWYPAVIDMNLSLEAGKVTAIVGESGSGKSTTALGLMSLLASNARMTGSVKVKDQEMLNAKAITLRKFRGKEVAYIFAACALVGAATSLSKLIICLRQLSCSCRLLTFLLGDTTALTWIEGIA